MDVNLYNQEDETQNNHPKTMRSAQLPSPNNTHQGDNHAIPSFK